MYQLHEFEFAKPTVPSFLIEYQIFEFISILDEIRSKLVDSFRIRKKHRILGRPSTETYVRNKFHH